MAAKKDFGMKASAVGGKTFSGISLVPSRGTSKVIKKPRKVNVWALSFFRCQLNCF